MKLEQAARQALEALVDHGTAYLHHEVHYSEAITALREALKEQAEQEPVLRGDDKFAPHERPQKLEPVTISCECGDIYERDSFGGRFIKLHGICPNCDAVPQAEQKPVAVVEITYGREPECYVTGNIDDFPEGVFKLYAAPVRTKDLTDDEIVSVLEYYDHEWDETTFAIARAVIAKLREKERQK